MVNGTNEANSYNDPIVFVEPSEEDKAAYQEGDIEKFMGCWANERARTVEAAMLNDPKEFIAAYHELRKFTLQYADLFERSHMIYLKACKLLEESEKKIANEPVTAEVIEINNAFFNSTAYPDQD